MDKQMLGRVRPMRFNELSGLTPGTWVCWVHVTGVIRTGIVLGVVPVPDTHSLGFLWALTDSGEVKIPVNLLFKLKVLS